MKNLLLLACFLISMGCFASKTDSLFQRHEVSFSVTNAMSLVLFNPNDFGSNEDESATEYYPFTKNNGIGTAVVPFSVTYLPLYSVHAQLGYSLGISKLIRLETGIGY
jgi:hypothetical protein